jgi:hypothetical protein
MPNLPTTAVRIPLPNHLRHLTGPEPPQLIGTTDVAQLFEFWGFARSGRDYLRKLEHSGTLTCVPVPLQKHKRWQTVAVLALWTGGNGA